MITENGGFLDPDGFEHGFLPVEPPEAPPNHFVDAAGRLHEVDPEQCAAYYRAQGKTLPEQVTLHLPDGTNEVHDWVGYGKRFREWHAAAAAGKQPPPGPTATAGASSSPADSPPEA